MKGIQQTLLVVLICCLACNASGQNYRLEYDIEFHIDECSGNRRYFNDTKFYTFNNQSVRYLSNLHMDEERSDQYQNGIIDIPGSEGPIQKLWSFTNREVQFVFWADDCSGGRDEDHFINTTGQHCFELTTPINWGCINSLSCDYVVIHKFKFYPMYTLTQSDPSGLLPVQDSIKFTATAGFIPSFYKWEYSLTSANGPWASFPSAYNGLNTFKASAANILGTTTANANINKPIWIRIHKDCGNSVDAVSPIQLNIRLQAPHIANVAPLPTTCFDAYDGKATVYFDRYAKANEKLFAIVAKIDTLAGGALDTNTVYIDSIVTTNKNFIATPNILQAGAYVVYLFGTYTANGFVNVPTYTGNLLAHQDTFFITKPPRVIFSDTSVNVWCYNGSDGEIRINAGGGVGNYSFRRFTTANPDTAWYPFSSATQHTISGLLPGTYNIKVRDGNGCVSKTLGGLGPDKVDAITITQPADSIHVDFVSQQIPTAYGFTDGNIHVAVYGGTINGNNTYNHTWTDANNTVVTTDSTWFANGQYHILLLHIGAGTYTLALHDKNYNLATTSAGCEMTRSYVMAQPLPLMVQLQIARLPSCNKTNTQADPYADGELVAHASGGTPFATGLPYLYTWKKKDAQNNWVVMTGYTDSITSALESGWYAVNVQDAHGIILGQYVSNVLVQATDSTIFLPEPALLTIHETVTPVTCNGHSNGAIISGVSGGTQPYRYFWNTGDSTANLSSLEAGGYFLFVRDTNGCRATKAIVVPEPVGYVLTVDTTAPTCHDGCDGGIGLHLIGGTQPYTYTWQQTTANIDTLSGLCSGTYHVTIADANGCSFGRVIMLDNPPLDPGIPKDTTLCNGQSARISMGIHDAGASYNWTSDNGFASADSAVILTAAGHYYAQLTNGKGCVGRDTFTIHRLNLDIAADMLLPTSAIAGEEIVLVNVSRPLPQIVEWILPQAATVLERNDNFIRFLFADTGTYPVTLRTGINDCREQITRNVVVSPDDNLPGVGATAAPFIEDLKVMPVPNDGHFTVLLNLHEISAATIRLIYLNSSAVLEQRSLSEHKQYVETFALPGLAPGLYMLLVETPQEKRTIKVIVQ